MMETLAYQLTAYSAAEVALLLVALQYFVLAPAWCVAALVLPGERRAAAWWAAYSGGSAVGLLLIVIGMHEPHAGSRALGNVIVFASTLALLRGIWAFTGQRTYTGVQAALLVTAAVLCWLAMDPAWVWLRLTAVAALWAALYVWAAVGVWWQVRHGMRLRWGWLYAAPMLLAAAMLALRSVRAIVSPDTVVYEIEQNTVLSVGSSLTGLVAALLLQMMLVSLLVSRLVGRLERLSRHDALTGLLNRRAMDDLLAQEEQRARRLVGQGRTPNTGQMAVLMIDAAEGVTDQDASVLGYALDAGRACGVGHRARRGASALRVPRMSQRAVPEPGAPASSQQQGGDRQAHCAVWRTEGDMPGGKARESTPCRCRGRADAGARGGGERDQAGAAVDDRKGPGADARDRAADGERHQAQSAQVRSG